MCKKKRLNELQVFSGVAILFVVLIHSLAYYLLNILNLTTYTDANFLVRLLHNIIYSAVPMFIFIAGYKYALNNIDDKYSLHIIKKIRSVLKPFLVISIMYLIKDITMYPEDYFSIRYIVTSIFNIFIGINTAYHLWYIPMYIFVSITYPLIYKLFKSDRIRIAVIVFIVIGQRLLGMKNPIMDAPVVKFVYYYLFYEMGVMFCKYNIKEKVRSYDMYIILCYIIVTILFSIVTRPFIHKQIQLYILCPISITAYYFISIRLKNSKLLNYLGKNSFYIYLFHEPTILTYTASKFTMRETYDSMSYVFLIAIIAIIISLMLYKIIRSTFLKYIFFNKNNKREKKFTSFKIDIDNKNS